MDIDEVRIAKKELGIAMREVVANLVESFYKTTGLSVQGIDIQMAELRRVGGNGSRHLVAGVKCRVEL